MHTDELRAELADLADEVEPFSGDVGAVRRRVNRSRITTTGTAIVVAAAALTGVVALTHSRSNHVQVVHSAKDVQLTQLSRFDAAVVLPSDATAADAERVKARLDATPAVVQFATLPAPTLAYDLKFSRTATAAALKTRVCANPSTQSFAVTLARATPDAQNVLTAAIGADATVQSLRRKVADVEVFMQVKASDAEILAVRERITADPDIVNNTFIDHQAAYADFKELFASQPVLIQNETPEMLPESFRLDVRDGIDLQTVADRYQGWAGVGQVILGTPTSWLVPQTRPIGEEEVFMRVKATNAQIQAVTEQLRRDPRVASYRYIDHAHAYAEFTQLFSEQPTVIASTPPASLPTSFTVALRRPDDHAAFESDYQGVTGVATVKVSDGGLADFCSTRP